VRETEEIEQYSNTSQVLKTMDANYVYCFPGEILIQNQKYECPLELFKLKPKVAFRTAQQLHVPNYISQNATEGYAVDAVHAGHFREDSDTIQHLAMFEQLRKERHKLVDLQNAYKDTISLKTSSPIFWLLTTVYISSVGGAVVYAGVRMYFTRRIPVRATAPRQQPNAQEFQFVPSRDDDFFS